MQGIQTVQERFAAFARAQIAGRAFTAEDFPMDIWEAMRARGLFDLSAQERMGGTYLALSAAAEALVAAGGNMGLALTWLMHEILSIFFIMGFGTADQQTRYGTTSAGAHILSLAVSEPGHGAHPKHLATTAEVRGDAYILNGDKTYLTNAPIAEVFIVVAVTGVREGRKEFTALLVPRATPGLTVTPLAFPFLIPARHGSLNLRDCPVPRANVLGRAGQAYADMVLPFRDLEDTLLMGLVTGAMTRQLDLLAWAARDKLGDAAAVAAVGQLVALTHAARLQAHAAALRLDGDRQDDELAALVMVFRNLAQQFHDGMAEMLDRAGGDAGLQGLHQDLGMWLKFARNVERIKQEKMGRAFLERE